MPTYIYEDTPQGRVYYGTQYNPAGERVSDPAVLQELQSGKIAASPKGTSHVSPSQTPMAVTGTQTPAGTTFVGGAPYAPGMAPGSSSQQVQQTPQYSQTGFGGGVQPTYQQPQNAPKTAPTTSQPSQPIDYTFHAGQETIEQYNARIAKARGYDAAQAVGGGAAQPQGAAPQGTPQGQLLQPTGSIYDTLVAAGQDPSFAARKQLAATYGIQGYTGTAAQNIDLEKKFLAAYNAQKGKVPDTPAAAQTALQSYFDDQKTTVDPSAAFMDSFANLDPISAMLFQQIAQMDSQINNRQSYAQMYAEEMAKSGIQPLQADLAQTIADIRMSEENVREQLAGGGGLVLESQVRGINAVRTKALLTKAEQLSNIIDSKNEAVDRMIQLTGLDRQEADSQFDRKLGLTKMLADHQMQMQDRARENYRQLISDVGYDGLVDSISNQQEFNQVAQSLGMSPQTLLQLSTVKTSAQRKMELEEMSYNLSVDKFNEDKRQFGMQYALEKQKLANQMNANTIVSPYQAEKTTRNIASINSLVPKISPATVGPGSYLSYVPGTGARDFDAEVNALKANIAFSELTAMREASKTGGALGAISDRELVLLQSSLGSLDTGQSPAAFKKSLETVKDNIYRWNAQVLSVGKGFDYEVAKKSGYSDEEIFNFLNK